MRLQHLELSGFGSYSRRCTLDLSEVDVCLITGSNGSGKTTLFDAVLWALYGHGNLRRVVNSSQPTATTVKVVCESDDGSVHTFRRERTGSKTRAWYAGPDGETDGSKPVTSAAVRLFGCDTKLLLCTAFSAHDGVGRLSAMQPLARRQLFNDMFIDRDTFTKLAGEAKAHHSSVRAERWQVHTRTQQAETISEQLNDRRDVLRIKHDAAERAHQRHQRLAEQAKPADRAALRHAQRQARQHKHIHEVELPDAIHRRRRAQQRLTSIESTPDHTAEAAAARQRAAQHQADCRHAQSKADEAGDRIKALQHAEAECWVCGAELTSERKRQLIADLRQDVADASTANDEYRRSAREAERLGRQARHRRSQITDAQQQIRQATSERDLLIEKRDLLAGAVSEAERLAEQAAGSPDPATVSDAERAARSASEQVGAAQTAVEEAEEHARQLPGLRRTLRKLTLREEAARWLSDAWHPKGVPSLLLKQHLQEITHHASDVLEQLSTTMRVRMVTAAGQNAALVIQCTPNGGPYWRDYDSFSGGEKTRIDIAIRLGLMRASNVAFRTLFLDEAWANLDIDGINAQAEMLINLVDNSELKAVYAVSHVPAVANGFPSHLRVTRTASGGSHARLVT